VLRELGEHPQGGAVQILSGRYGPYINYDKLNVTLPKEIAPEAVTMEQAVALLTAKAAAPAKSKKRRTARTRTAAAEAPTASTSKKRTAKKSTAKRSTSKKSTTKVGAAKKSTAKKKTAR
jgi:DNA topoisomerase-1